MDHLKGGRQGQIAVVALDREVERTYPLGMLHHVAGNRPNSNYNGSWPKRRGKGTSVNSRSPFMNGDVLLLIGPHRPNDGNPSHPYNGRPPLLKSPGEFVRCALLLFGRRVRAGVSWRLSWRMMHG